MSYFWNDVRLAVRTLRRSPGFTLTAILLLGFGVGANTALFSLLHAVLLRPIPGVERPDELVRIHRTRSNQEQRNQSYPDYLDYRNRSRTLAGLAAERPISLRLAGPPAQLVPGGIVSGNYFQVLGVQAAAGRLLEPSDDVTPGGHPVVVLSHGFWQRQFGGDLGIVGRKLTLNGRDFIVIGVAAPSFEGVEFTEAPAMWIPMMMARYAMTRNPSDMWLQSRSAGWLTLYGRLSRGTTLEGAEAELSTIARRLEILYPESNTRRGVRLHANPNMSPSQRADLSSLLTLLATAVVVLLFIACGNLANLQLTRAAARSREVAVRLALGASRWNLLRLLLAESLLLGLAGGALGLSLAPWIFPLLRSVWNPQQLVRVDATVLDLRVLAFTLGVSLLTVVLSGWAPAWRASQIDLAASLKAGSAQAGRQSGLTRVWVAAQVMLSVALVMSGSMVLRSMQRILALDPGYRPEPVVMATVDLSIAGYSEERGRQFFLNLLDRVSALPGVRSASSGKSSPAVDWSDRLVLFRPGEAPPSSVRYAEEPGGLLVDGNVIAPGYFRTLGIPLMAGRDFNHADRTGSPAVAIISQALAKRLWPGQNPLGRQVICPIDGRPLPVPLEVIGVAADSRYRNLLDEPPLLLYVPLLQTYDSIARLMVAVDGNPEAFGETLRQTIQQTDPDLPVLAIDTMKDQLARGLWRQHAASWLLSCFAALAVALACAGIYGVVAQGVAQRTREIGIRMALGARHSHVVRQVVSQAFFLAVMGIAAGLPLALWARPAMASLLYRSSALDPAVVAGVPLLFLAVASAASFLPARRATRIHPAEVLRQE